MVPVRKPGRPLSACPHPRDRPCGCSGVTAAIPKKQTCHCGGDASSTAVPDEPPPRPAEPSTVPTSPSRAAFKVQKPSARSHQRRTSSFDVANFDRIDMSHVNMVPFELRQSTSGPIPYLDGFALSSPSQEYGFVPQYRNIQPQHYKPLMHVPPQMSPATSVQMGSVGNLHQMGPEYAFTLPVDLDSVVNHEFNNGTSSDLPLAPTDATSNETIAPRPCCATKPSGHSHSSSSASSISEPQEPAPGSCCSSKPTVKSELVSAETPLMALPSHQTLLADGMPLSPALYPQYVAPGTVFTYPSTYGSFQNPLQPSAWRQGIRTNDSLPPKALIQSAAPPLFPSTQPETKDSTHTCNCGDSCQCVGCAAHPYNDATQDYVRSAWSSMAVEHRLTESYTNGSASIEPGQPATNGANTETASSPTANTPSSSTSGAGDEQNLSATDFFFVTYPFATCGGDTESCLCGDDCQCLGCTIHSQGSRHTSE